MKKSKYTEQDYQDKCSQLNLIYLGYYKDKKEIRIKYQCTKHYDIGIQNATWSHFKTAKKGCPYCIGRHKTTDDISALLLCRNIELLSEYHGSDKHIDCRCLKCNHEWRTISRAITSNGSGCPQCGIQNRTNKRTITHEEFVTRLNMINSNIEPIEQYKGTHKKIMFKCNKCNNIFGSYPANLLNGSCGCARCNLSIAENQMLMILEKHHIPYESQYVIEDCKNIFPLKFDAFDVNKNIAFEYNGEQHYKNVWIKNHYIDNDELKMIQERDRIKKEYCENHNIPIIIIPYWEKNNMENFILNELNKNNIYY